MSEVAEARPIPAARGCGASRVAGGVYWALGVGPGGKPVEYFLRCPPILLPKGFRLPIRGVTTLEVNGVTHVVDRIGRGFYPNVADYVEETRRLGLSRRIPSNFPFEKLTAKSRLFLVHDLAWIGNTEDYRHWNCPHGIPEHMPEADHGEPFACSGVWWQDVTGGVPLHPEDPLDRAVTRTMPSFSYVAHRRPDGVHPQYQPAILGSFPASAIQVIAGGGEDGKRALQNAQKTQGITVEEVDQ